MGKSSLLEAGLIPRLEQTHELVRRLSNRQLRLWLGAPLQRVPTELSAYRPKLKEAGRQLLLCLPAGESAGSLLQNLCGLGLQIQDFETDQSGLEEVFLQLTGMKEVAGGQ